MYNLPVHCPVCHLAVAPFDPERVHKELGVYHRPCLGVKEARDDQEAAAKIMALRQFTTMPAARCHTA